jgi:hypothetical protein
MLAARMRRSDLSETFLRCSSTRADLERFQTGDLESFRQGAGLGAAPSFVAQGMVRHTYAST